MISTVKIHRRQGQWNSTAWLTLDGKPFFAYLGFNNRLIHSHPAEFVAKHKGKMTLTGTPFAKSAANVQLSWASS
ncbi:MAG: hypothetical protein IPO38_06200 [Rhodocyclaceae bacterium]|nr:hypothetical protein [Rhodocyclaceae bacterium]